MWKFDREESLSTQSHSSCNIVPKDLHSFLLGLGLEVYYDTFEKHGVDLYSLGLLNYNDLKDVSCCCFFYEILFVTPIFSYR